MDLRFMSVTVEDMDRATEFYRRFLDAEPVSEADRLVEFAFDGVTFGLHDPTADGIDPATVTFGNNAIPAFAVPDLDAELDRVSAFADVAAEREAPDHRWAVVEDTEGNHVEIYESPSSD